MPDRKNPKPPDYVVGYRRPPRASQFTAGQSGNPKGRPKGTRPVGAILQEILRQKVTVTKNGKTCRIPAIEAMFRRLANEAMREPRAMKLLLSLIERYGASPEATPHLGDVLAEDREILAQYLPEPPGTDPDSSIRSDEGSCGDGV
jgi:hypothetical protein